MNHALHIGEIIESNSSSFRFQLKSNPFGETEAMPALGSLVRVALAHKDRHILGLVYHIETSSIDTVHRPVALNLTRQELKEQQPQIFDLLKTDVCSVIVGYQENRRYFQYLPPHPPQIHDFVYQAQNQEVKEFTERLFFLNGLLSNPLTHDEVIAAFIRQSYQARQNDEQFLKQIGQTLSNLLKDNYERLVSIIQRLS